MRARASEVADRDAGGCLDDNLAAELASGAISGAALTRIEGHLAGCRDCRALVAALAGGDDHDSNAATHKHERVTESQAGSLPNRLLTIGDRVGRYLVLSTLGSGGMGVVFSAYDPQLDRKVALKLLRANLGANAKDARARLKREAQAIAQLNHPNVVAVYDVGTTDDGDVYIAMEFVEGDTLTTWLTRWPRTWREILEVFHQAARGLQAAHGVGLLHRDFKPDNVLVGGDARVRVTDFGLARSVLGPDEVVVARPAASTLHVELTATGTVLGTPRYMPPEQLTGPDIDARSDQFSFCVALYEALYGTHPLPGATSASMLERGDRALPVPDGTRVPAPIGRAVLRGLERERSKRFPTMATLMTELAPPQQRSPARLVAVVALGLVLVGGATAAVMSRPDARVVVEPHEEVAVKQLYSHIKQLEDDRKRLQQRLLEIEPDLRELEHLKQALVDKGNEIQDLVDQMTVLRANEIRGARPKPPAQSELVTAAVQGAQHDVEGCFDEWAERAGVERRARARDADVLVRLSITPDGAAHSATATGVDSPSLTMCVSDALSRVHYAKGSEQLDIQISIAWTTGGNLSMSARVVGHREAPRSTPDL